MKQAIEGYLQLMLMMISICVLFCIVDLNHKQNNLALCKEHVITRMNHFHSPEIRSSDLEMCKGVLIQTRRDGDRYRVKLIKHITLFSIDLPLKLEDSGLTYMIQT
ncbi:hypothetical protein ERYAMS2_00498 [Erysipelothrix amsterdamensis]|uniref:Uncharacterized protein n=1 Tax=Erysipelothrix amsterdamensis TaxID=2929157 RepID=A0AAU9VH43_9FIRM|nr:hypothetical protein ERYAMS2_00498 [Erysipelothrix sp. A18Y020d]CAH2761055.1 hypothetical protein ERYAMS_00208 [Erysipelothrix sp. A18Y020d]